MRAAIGAQSRRPRYTRRPVMARTLILLADDKGGALAQLCRELEKEIVVYLGSASKVRVQGSVFASREETVWPEYRY
jgi:hypothetical protein